MNLEIRQKYPLELKVAMSKVRIRQWYKYYHGNVYVSFSGGKDSTVLLDLVRSEYPDVLGVFVNTGLEYPEIVRFVNKTNNVIKIKPKERFVDVLDKYGYPIVSKEVSQKVSEVRTTKSEKLYNKRLYGDEKGNGKIPLKWQYLIDLPFKISHKCCDVLKKRPARKFEKETGLYPYIGTMAADSRLRLQKYYRHGCNSFTGKEESLPLSFWTEQDIWDYIKSRDLDYSKIYDMGYKNTGCTFCCFGVHRNNPNKFQLMKKTHPKMWDYCINKLKIDNVLNFMNVNFG